MTPIERRAWRENVRDTALSYRLEAAGCPIPLQQILAERSMRGGLLMQWVRSSLDAGVTLRSAQAEHIARGDSLVETALATGVEVEGVLYTLCRLEADEVAVSEYHYSS